ncbi:MAG: class I SAM-dependent methyltransferase [Thermoleophilaceae bacterium]
MTRAHVAAWADHPDLVEYYTAHRHRPEDLYPSERRFLPALAEESQSVLDVGCAAGGFAAVWRNWNPALSYAGVDASEPLVEAARRLHPECEFEVADCAEGLPFADGAFDSVQALGWLHWEPRFEDALAEMWRVTRRRLFFDVRLQTAEAGHLEARQRIALSGEWDGRTTVPYLCLSWERFAESLLGLGPAAILAHGYEGTPSDTVTGVQGDICFATFVVERGGAAGRPLTCIALPYEWPDALRERVDLRRPPELDVLIPTEEALA